MPVKYTVDEIIKMMIDIEYRMWEHEAAELLDDPQFNYKSMGFIFDRIKEQLSALCNE